MYGFLFHDWVLISFCTFDSLHNLTFSLSIYIYVLLLEKSVCFHKTTYLLCFLMMAGLHRAGSRGQALLAFGSCKAGQLCQTEKVSFSCCINVVYPCFGFQSWEGNTLRISILDKRHS